jgi:hypothetical protein
MASLSPERSRVDLDRDDSPWDLWHEIEGRLDHLRQLNVPEYSWKEPVAELRELIDALPPGASRDFTRELDDWVAEAEHSDRLTEINMGVGLLEFGDETIRTSCGRSREQLVQELRPEVDDLGEGDAGPWLDRVRRDLETAQRTQRDLHGTATTMVIQGHGSQRHRRASHGGKTVRRRGSTRSRDDPDGDHDHHRDVAVSASVGRSG